MASTEQIDTATKQILIAGTKANWGSSGNGSITHGFDWEYYFPKLHLIDVRPLRKALDARQRPDWVGYSPVEAFAAEQEERERDRELTEMRQSMEEAHRKTVQQARDAPPPSTVTAYRDIYGRIPRGWP